MNTNSANSGWMSNPIVCSGERRDLVNVGLREGQTKVPSRETTVRRPIRAACEDNKDIIFKTNERLKGVIAHLEYEGMNARYRWLMFFF